MTTIATADLYDERGDELDSLALQLHDIGGHVAFDGPVRTIRCHRDNALVKELLATPGEGAVLVIDGGGLVTLYGHCSQIRVREGQTVKAGETVAKVGSTGRSTGNHLHFEVRVNGVKQNPRSYLP